MSDNYKGRTGAPENCLYCFKKNQSFTLFPIQFYGENNQKTTKSITEHNSEYVVCIELLQNANGDYYNWKLLVTLYFSVDLSAKNAICVVVVAVAVLFNCHMYLNTSLHVVLAILALIAKVVNL